MLLDAVEEILEGAGPGRNAAPVPPSPPPPSSRGPVAGTTRTPEMIFPQKYTGLPPQK
jgi:hypothetical protein